MKKKAMYILILISIFMSTNADAQMINTMTYNSIRAAHCTQPQICDAFLNRLKDNKYNYAVVEFTFWNSDEIIGNKDVYSNLRNDIKNVCIALNSKGIRLIPMFQMSSQWSLGWKTIRDYENPNIGINSITCNRENPEVIKIATKETFWTSLLGAVVGKTTETYPICEYTDNLTTVNQGSNSWAYEPNGVDQSIIDVFGAIKQGFSEANVRYPLEFVHLGHDEPQFLNWCIIAGIGAPCETAYPYKGNLARGEISTADANYIQSKINAGFSKQNAYQTLLADEIHRRVCQAEQVFGPKVKIMIYGDTYDNQSWGAVPLWIQYGHGDKITLSGVIDLPGLDENQKAKVKNQVIPILWNYHGKVERADNPIEFLTRSDYNSNSAFDRFASRGFKILYCGALQVTGTAILPSNDSKHQIDEYSSISRNYQNNCLGYYAAAWVDTYNPSSPDSKWNILEYMYTGCANNTYLPVKDFKPESANLIASILNLLID